MAKHKRKCSQRPEGAPSEDAIRVSCNESSLYLHSVQDASHDVQLDEEELKQEVVGGKRLADHPSVVLEKAVEEGPRPPKVPRLQARKAVPPFEDKSLGAPTLDDIFTRRVTRKQNFKNHVLSCAR